MARYLAAVGVLTASALALNVYINPYSLHVFVYAGHAEFDTPPGADGTVEIGAQRLDFRAPRLSFTRASLERIDRELTVPDEASDFAVARAVTDYVRSRLNARDTHLPRAAWGQAEALLTCGDACAAQCGEHARAFWELTQLRRMQSRMLWLEGHVAAEYFDREERAWVYIDPHLGVCLCDETGRRLSAAQAIRRAEQDQFLDVHAFTESGRRALTYRELQRSQPKFYRNVLLNGELAAYAGSVLVESGRWTHLLRHARRPQVLVLTGEFDTSHGRYVQPLSLRSVAVTVLLLGLSFALVRMVLRGRYSTVTLLARFRGRSTLHSRTTAT